MWRSRCLKNALLCGGLFLIIAPVVGQCGLAAATGGGPRPSWPCLLHGQDAHATNLGKAADLKGGGPRYFFLPFAQVSEPPRAGVQTASQPENPAAKPAKPQPLPFSHKLHTQFLPDCLDCHALSSDGWTMGYPPETRCMECHASVKADSPAIRRLAAFNAEKKPVPWVQIYKVPDFVFFSHRTHIKKAKLACEACHGPVRERDVLTKEKPTSMQSCIACHKEKGAEVGCRTCHNAI